jgi:hypothetical protein
MSSLAHSVSIPFFSWIMRSSHLEHRNGKVEGIATGTKDRLLIFPQTRDGVVTTIGSFFDGGIRLWSGQRSHCEDSSRKREEELHLENMSQSAGTAVRTKEIVSLGKDLWVEGMGRAADWP